MAEYEKLERDGKIAVLYSPGYGAGWAWNCADKDDDLIFDKDIVELVLANKINEAVRLADEKHPGSGIYSRCCRIRLCVEWVPKGTRFIIEEYDGHEGVTIIGPDYGHIA